MNKIKINKLIVKLIDNTINDIEAEELKIWLLEEDNLAYFNEFIETTHLINTKQEFLFNDSFKSVMGSINKRKNKFVYWKYAIAASIVLLISVNFLFNKNKVVEVINPTIVTSNIPIGTDKATLTLDDGTTIALEKGQHYISGNLESNGEALVYNSEKGKNAEIAYNYLTIPRGGQYYVKLSDGTEVWLNSESQIKYPVAFIQGETRQVELVYGEAYFDVSPSTNHEGANFKVLTGAQKIEVLGTEFNINAYKNENAIYTTLIEGKVSVASQNSKTTLNPNQQSIINNQKFEGIHVVNADVYSVTSWRKGVFSFDKMPLEKIMKVLGRWYDVDAVFVDSKLKEEQFTGVLRKNQNIEDILNSIQTTNNMAYVIKNNTIIFK